MKIAFIASVALMFVACSTNSTPAVDTPASAQPTTCETKASDFAFVEVEYVLSQSDIYNTEGIALRQKTERSQTQWAQQEQGFQEEAMKLQDKYQRGLITTSNAQAEQERIQQRVVAFQKSAQTQAQKLEEENLVFTNRTRDLMQRAVAEVNADKRYKFILDASMLIDADSTCNITMQVIEAVNRLYAEDNAKK